MTAEIAILNRGAVALAADSAVTLPDNVGGKIYDSGEKIFELSDRQPVALMIYNVGEFMGIPLEVLIREYRRKTNKQFNSLSEIKNDFFKFLQEHTDNVENTMVNFENWLLSEISHLNRFTIEGLPECYLQTDQWMNGLREVLEDRENNPKAKRPDDFLTGTTFEEFSGTFGEVVRKLVVEHLYFPEWVDDDFKNEIIQKMSRLMFSVVRSDERSPAYTGFVFAGCGADTCFPALCAVEYDGIYFKQLRLLNDREISIDAGSENRAAIVPFAQKDMPQRFINGIDDEFELQFKGIVESIFTNFLSRVNAVITADAAEILVERAVSEFNAGLKELKDGSENRLKSVVEFLSKKELADVAHSLVELTSRKRRYSSDMETVGGPIDVAILTRNEGFIRVRRKHYFHEELNPRFFNRLRRNGIIGGNRLEKGGGE